MPEYHCSKLNIFTGTLKLIFAKYLKIENALPLRQFWKSPKALPAERAWAWAGYDNKYLRFYTLADDSDIFTKATANKQKLWQLGDTMEFFIKPDKNQPAYWEIHVAPNNVIMDILIPERDPYKAGRTPFEQVAKADSHCRTKVQRMPNKWLVQLRIPWKTFGLEQVPLKGTRWQFAVCRYNYWSDRKTPEYSSTAFLSKLDYHRFEEYHDLVFD
jgi:hypothetical protein